MTVKELIEALGSYSPDRKVMFRVPSHDYWGTELAYDANSVSYGSVEYSDYHNCNQLADSEDAETIILID
jgi:hypothetical protein